MTTNRFQGDPAITLTKNGASMRFIGGQPVMDSGLENAALISLFTRRGWWGNVLFNKESEKIGSDFEMMSNQPVVNLQSVNSIEAAAERAVEWFKDVKLASDIEVTVSNPRSDYIKTDIKIYPPGRDVRTLLFIKNGLNWINQAQNPAHDRFPRED